MGTTRTGRALQLLIDSSLHKGNRPDFPDILIVITDGRSSDEPKKAAEELRRSVCISSLTGVPLPILQGVKTFALGITTAVERDQLLDIAGDESRYIVVDDFTNLDSGVRHQLLGDGQCRTITGELIKYTCYCNNTSTAQYRARLSIASRRWMWFAVATR